jgi:two-component system sensor histidine kinase BaeS
VDDIHVKVDEQVREVQRREQAETDAGETARERQYRRRHEDGAGRSYGHHLSFSARLILAFVLTAAMTSVIAACILAYVWGGQFRSYTNNNVQNLIDTTASRLAEGYMRDGQFSEETLSRASLASSLYPNLGVRVMDQAGDVLYDDTADLPYTDGDETLEELASSSIVTDHGVVGSITAWVRNGDEELSQTDLNFRRSSYEGIVFAALIATALAAIVGFIASRGLMSSVNRVTEAARKVKSGDLSARTGMVGEDEVSQLGETFDAMADTLERDRNRERRLTADVAHELRTPLMGIQATVEAIIDGVFPAGQQRLVAINTETQRLERLVEALLRLSRYESGSVPFNERPIDITELISGLFMSHEALLDDAGITHSFICDDEPVIVDGDADMIRQAASNLISNAVRYNCEGGDVTVEVHRSGPMGVISVSDTGIGIAPEDLDKVFSRFWRADSGRTRASGGLGVGLAVVKEIADYHNGTISVDSEVGKGTTFSLSLPLHVDEAIKPAKGISSVIRRPQGTTRTRQRSSKQAATRQKKQRSADAKSERTTRDARQEKKSARKEEKEAKRTAKARQAATRHAAEAHAEARKQAEKNAKKKRNSAISTSTLKVLHRIAASRKPQDGKPKEKDGGVPEDRDVSVDGSSASQDGGTRDTRDRADGQEHDEPGTGDRG